MDLPALRRLAEASLSRDDLKAAGYLPLVKSSDLHWLGYNVVYWARVGEPESETLEYVPRRTVTSSSLLPRVVVRCWEEQASLHRALGIGVVGRGEVWHRKADRSPGLFDALERTGICAAG